MGLKEFPEDYFFERRDIVGVYNKLKVVEDCQKNIYYELDDIRKMVIGDYYERNLKRTILYLIRKYMYKKYEVLSSQIDSIIYFIGNSISSDYYDSKTVLLDSIVAYSHFFGESADKDVNFLLNLLPYVKRDCESSELWELLYEEYSDAVEMMFWYYKQNESYFNINMDTTCIPLTDIGLHEAIINEWKTNKLNILSRLYTRDSDYLERVSSYFDEVVLIETASKNSPGLAKLISYVQDEFYVKDKLRKKARPGYITRIGTSIKDK